MPRGGKREGAGRPSKWLSGVRVEETKVIRVPKSIADKVLQIAYKIDSGADIFYIEDFNKLLNTINTLSMQNKELNEQIDLLIKRNSQLLKQMNNNN